jgi:hypothetical protein
MWPHRLCGARNLIGSPCRASIHLSNFRAGSLATRTKDPNAVPKLFILKIEAPPPRTGRKGAPNRTHDATGRWSHVGPTALSAHIWTAPVVLGREGDHDYAVDVTNSAVDVPNSFSRRQDQTICDRAPNDRRSGDRFGRTGPGSSTGETPRCDNNCPQGARAPRTRWVGMGLGC